MVHPKRKIKIKNNFVIRPYGSYACCIKDINKVRNTTTVTCQLSLPPYTWSLKKKIKIVDCSGPRHEEVGKLQMWIGIVVIFFL